MKIFVAGCGFVGSSIIDGLETLRPGVFDIVKYDPFLFPTESDINKIHDCDIAFVCVPTPMSNDGSMDDSYLDNILHQISDTVHRGLFSGVVVIKSTTTPEVVKRLVGKYCDVRIVTNPEFLTERTALHDFINTKWVILGGEAADVNLIHCLSADLWPNAKISIVSVEGAMMVKYMTNTFFSVKVSLMNEFYDLYAALGGKDWYEVVEALKTDERVGSQHCAVPGPDGHRGIGGKCLVKDTNAMISMAEKLGTVNNVMKAVPKTNEVVRSDKNWLTIKGATSANKFEKGSSNEA